MGKIPKIIHYCWVGGNPKPQSVLYCIESWKKFCPDYEIKEWNESNYDFNKNEYMKQAYEAKKWGFVPDYARLDIVYQYGGIYLDTDVEIVRNFDDLLEYDAFMGFENTGNGEYFVNCGHGFGARPNHPVIKKARDLYNDILFKKDNGELNMIPSPYYTTQTLRQYGIKQENREQKLDDLIVFKTDVLCPKNFKTGKIRLTDNTHSIHHFTASWLDEKIRDEMEKRQKLENRYGVKITSLLLYSKSVFEKYHGKKLITELPVRVIKKLKFLLLNIIKKGCLSFYLMKAYLVKVGNGAPIILDTAMESDNLGDQIIMENCKNNFPVCIKQWFHVPTHRFPTEGELKKLNNSKMKLLCGTNILSGHMDSYGLWRMSKQYGVYKNTILMGVGFDSANKMVNSFTRRLFKIILNKNYMHSVRDSFSEKQLKSMGIKNVLNTGCPTMWKLTEEHCKTIPVVKGANVICTITDYCQDVRNDRDMIEILNKNYDQVYLWIQGENDLEYANKLDIYDKVIVIQDGLSGYDEILKMDDLDYVGTRLHAGIRALSAGHRSIIIAIDNRAKAISEDTNLPIINREDIELYLNEKIQSNFETKIVLQTENIEKWKSQFIQRTL